MSHRSIDARCRLIRDVRPIEHPMLHHLSFAVADLARSGAFYDAVLAPLGIWSRLGG